MQRRKKLFGSSREDELRMAALANSLVEEKLGRLFQYKIEIQNWEAKRERILGDLRKRQLAVRAEMSQLQKIEDLVKKRYMMKSLLQQWRTMELTLEHRQRELNTRITTLAAQFRYELSVLASYTSWLKNGDKEVLVQGYAMVVIEDLIGISQRLDDTIAKPDLVRNICEMIDIAAALDARTVHAHAKIVQFRKASPYLQGGILRKFPTRHPVRERPPAHHQQQPHQPLDE